MSSSSAVFSGGGGGGGRSGVLIFGLLKHIQFFLQNVTVLFIENALKGTHHSALTYTHPNLSIGPLGIWTPLRVEGVQSLD
jgi:hypothetical protein